jgi:hypothetical protein
MHGAQPLNSNARRLAPPERASCVYALNVQQPTRNIQCPAFRNRTRLVPSILKAFSRVIPILLRLEIPCWLLDIEYPIHGQTVTKNAHPWKNSVLFGN